MRNQSTACALLSDRTKVLYASGKSTTIDRIVKGNTVMGADGKSALVKNVFHGSCPMYEFSGYGFTPFYAGEDQIISFALDDGIRVGGLKPVVNMSVREYLALEKRGLINGSYQLYRSAKALRTMGKESTDLYFDFVLKEAGEMKGSALVLEKGGSFCIENCFVVCPSETGEKNI